MASIMVYQGLLYRGPWVKITYALILLGILLVEKMLKLTFTYLFHIKLQFLYMLLNFQCTLHIVFSFQEKAQVDTLHFWDGERKIDIILGTIHLLRQQKDWVGGFQKQQFLLTFIPVGNLRSMGHLAS